MQATLCQAPNLPRGRIVPLDVAPCPGRRQGALQAVDAGGRTVASARFDGAEASDRVELSLVLGPGRPPPTELIGELVRSTTAALAASAGAGRLVVDFDPACRLGQGVVAASGLDWRVRPTRDGAVAELSLDETVAPAPPRNASVVRTHPPGVTVMPSAEGPSLRSDPRWTPGQARRTDRLLGRLVALHRSSTARSRPPHRSHP